MVAPSGQRLGSNKFLESARNAFTIGAGDDSADLQHPTRGLYVGGTGNVHVTMMSGDDVTFVAMTAGVVHPIRVLKVFSTGTSASDIIGLH